MLSGNEEESVVLEVVFVKIEFIREVEIVLCNDDGGVLDVLLNFNNFFSENILFVEIIF